MSLKVSPLATLSPQDDIHVARSLDDTGSPVQPATPNTGHFILDHVNNYSLSTTYQQDHIRSATHETNAKDEAPHETSSPIVEESSEARIERLGRQRPEVFDSVWSEIGFVFSIAMSQVLTVCPSIFRASMLLTLSGILCLRLYCHSSHVGKRLTYTIGIGNMAGQCLLLNTCVFPFSFWSSRRHVWSMPCLCWRTHVAHYLEFNHRLFEERDHVELLSCSGWSWISCFSSIVCHAIGKYLSAWPEEEPGIQHIRIRRRRGILHRHLFCWSDC